MKMDEDKWRERMESKVDALSETLIEIARMEERIVALLGRMDRFDEHQSKLNARITYVTDRVVEIEKRNISLSFVERMLWVTATAVVSGAAMWFFSDVVG